MNIHIWLTMNFFCKFMFKLIAITYRSWMRLLKMISSHCNRILGEKWRQNTYYNKYLRQIHHFLFILCFRTNLETKPDTDLTVFVHTTFNFCFANFFQRAATVVFKIWINQSCPMGMIILASWFALSQFL